jgi:succinate-semialdehyde dehydrogenase/glutarate-semialdehyde dehydrogenase
MYENYGLFIGGTWRKAVSGAMYPTINPSTEEPLGAVPSAGPADAEAAIAAAQNGLTVWRNTHPFERSKALRTVAQLMTERMEEIAKMMVLEMGKPIAQARREIQNSLEHFEWNAEEAKRLYGETLPSRTPNGRITVEYQPVGIVAAYSAWNFPILLPARKIAPALAAGCSIIVRPADETPGCAMLLVACCHDAGMPAGVVNLLTGSPANISPTLMASAAVRKVSLTGSTRVGKLVLADAAQTIKRVSMELGGHAPVIVCDDADAEAVATLAVPTKFANGGQVCVSPTRFYVHESKEAAFTKRFVEVTKSLKVGDGFDPNTQMGPLANKRRRDDIEALVERTKSEGAELLAGGHRPAGINHGYFFEPTVFGRVPETATIMKDEPFGPIAPITTFRDFDDVIARANSLEYGLASYVFTKSQKRAQEASARIESGMVGVNTFLLSVAEAPFGGVKQSGFGREGGAQGIKDYLDVKMTHMVAV